MVKESRSQGEISNLKKNNKQSTKANIPRLLELIFNNQIYHKLSGRSLNGIHFI